jgi:hypothetical protein
MMMGQLQFNNAYPQSSSVNEYLMGALPNLVNTGGYIPSNQTMSFGLNQPKSFVSSNPIQFDGSMNLVGDSKPFNWQAPVTPTGGIPMTDKINAGVGVFNSALGAISAYKALKLGKENLAFQKDSFNRNFEAMKGTTNAQLADRQAARVRNYGTGVYDSVADYMAKYGVK